MACLSFAPDSIFAFLRWASNAYGTAQSRIDILRAVAPGEGYITVADVHPGGDSLIPLGAAVGPRRLLERDGVTRDGEKGRTFGAAKDRADAVAFARRGLNDRHHFRFVVTPEDAAEMTGLRALTRDLAVQMESDLGTRLDWVGIAH